MASSCGSQLKTSAPLIAVLVLFVFQFSPVCNVDKFISFGLGTVMSERVNVSVLKNN